MVILFYALKNSLRSSEKFRPITIKLTLAAFSPIFFFSSLDSFKNPIMALIQAYIAHFLYYNSLETGTNLTLKYKTLSEKKMCKKKLQFLSTSHNAFFVIPKNAATNQLFLHQDFKNMFRRYNYSIGICLLWLRHELCILLQNCPLKLSVEFVSHSDFT